MFLFICFAFYRIQFITVVPSGRYFYHRIGSITEIFPQKPSWPSIIFVLLNTKNTNIIYKYWTPRACAFNIIFLCFCGACDAWEKGFVGLRATVFILIDAYPPEPSYYVLNMHLSYGAAFYCFLSVTIPVKRQTSFISHYTHYTSVYTHMYGFHSSPLLFTFRRYVMVRKMYEQKFCQHFLNIFWQFWKKNQYFFKTKIPPHNIVFKENKC